MENKASSKSTILNYGLYFGIITVLISVVKYAMDAQYTQEWYSGVAGIIAMIVLIIMGLKSFRNSNITMTFGQGVKIGIGITFIGTLMIIAYYALFGFVIEPDFKMKSLEAQKTVLADVWGMTDAQIEEATKSSADYFYLSTFGGIFIFNLFLGGITSLIAGAVMKRAEVDTYL